MRIFRHYKTLPDEARGAAIAIGNFDGVHLGHLAVVNAARTFALAANIPWAVLTLEPHPRSVFQPDSEPYRLTPLRSKVRQLEKLGVDFYGPVPGGAPGDNETPARYYTHVLERERGAEPSPFMDGCMGAGGQRAQQSVGKYHNPSIC